MWIEHAFLPGFLTGNENISNASMEGWFEDGLRTCGAEADAIDIEWGQRKGQFHVDHGYRERAHGRFAHVQRLQIRAEDPKIVSLTGDRLNLKQNLELNLSKV